MFYIQAKQIAKKYGSRSVVKDVNFKVDKNEKIAVIGPNGAGKTTTLEILVGLRSYDEGEVVHWSSSYKEHIGVQLQSVPFFPGLTALENLRLFSAFYKKKLTKEEARELLVKCQIVDAKDTEASKLSGGQQKRLAIATALVHDPELVFLDEPTAALDPRSRISTHNLINQLFLEGKTIVFTTHDMDEVVKLATRVVMIDDGRVITEGNPVQLCKEHRVNDLEQLYLKLTDHSFHPIEC
ncbi:ABC transporter ATP-binding protein [Cytobacillus sp. FJAT-54145]|uniref:ABC transporter ATP-binding protein n=1 Tax=Cytobacillus spartinae TaxID=3299023 RepID=A0ABW6KH30_9BACI